MTPGVGAPTVGARTGGVDSAVLALVVLFAALAGGASWLELPAGERPGDWDSALALVGPAGASGVVRVRVDGETWVLTAEGASGARATRVPAPRSGRAREDVALLAASLLEPGPVAAVPLPRGVRVDVDDGVDERVYEHVDERVSVNEHVDERVDVARIPASPGPDASKTTGRGTPAAIAERRPDVPAASPAPSPSPARVSPVVEEPIVDVPEREAPRPTDVSASALARPEPLGELATSAVPEPLGELVTVVPAADTPQTAPTPATTPPPPIAAPPPIAPPPPGLSLTIGPAATFRDGLTPAPGARLGGHLHLGAFTAGAQVAGSVARTELDHGFTTVRAGALVGARAQGAAGVRAAVGPAVHVFVFREGDADPQTGVGPALLAEVGAGVPVTAWLRVELYAEGGLDLRAVEFVRGGETIAGLGRPWVGAGLQFRAGE